MSATSPNPNLFIDHITEQLMPKLFAKLGFSLMASARTTALPSPNREICHELGLADDLPAPTALGVRVSTHVGDDLSGPPDLSRWTESPLPTTLFLLADPTGQVQRTLTRLQEEFDQKRAREGAEYNEPGDVVGALIEHLMRAGLGRV